MINLGDKNKFVPYGANGEKNCLNICKAILRKYGLTDFGSSSNIYRLMYEDNKQLKYYGNNPRENYHNAIKCIDEHLEAGRPIIVGVNYQYNRNINEGTTDHFVVIYGKDYDKELKCNCYLYYETGRGNVNDGFNEKLNRFIYVDSKKPSFYNPQSNHTSKARYDVIQIRPNDGTIV